MPGAAEILGVKPEGLPEVAASYLRDKNERPRREESFERVSLYLDDSETILKQVVNGLFENPEVKKRICKFAGLGNSQSLVKRVVDEISRPVYAIPPVRKITSGEEVFKAIEAETELNLVMDLACRLTNACNTVALYTRYVPSAERMVVDVITPDMMTVVPHPDIPSQAIATIFDRKVRDTDGKIKTWSVWVDDVHALQLDENHKPVAMRGLKPSPGLVYEHGHPKAPVIFIHRRKRWGRFWDSSTGRDLVAADKARRILLLLALRLLKTHGFNQLAVEGEIQSMPKGQIMDEESLLVLPENTTIQSIGNKSDAAHYIEMMDAIVKEVASNYGISLKRLNLEAGAEADSDALLEQRADAVKVMRDAELRQFEIMKMVSTERPAGSIPQDATVEVDFGEVVYRTDPVVEIEVMDALEKHGVINVLDWIKRRNPEIRTDDEAWKEFEKNLEVRAKKVEKMRALNMSEDADLTTPGVDPQQAGALGTEVRDGRMSKDDAAEAAKGRTE